MVLAVVKVEDTYGYKITQEIRKAMDVSESTLYPVLRRLQKENYLETYDMSYMGRNRRYYRITQKGIMALEAYKEEWENYKKNIDNIMLNGGAQ
jgi:PadR family transcriptional regulator PadR